MVDEFSIRFEYEVVIHCHLSTCCQLLNFCVKKSECEFVARWHLVWSYLQFSFIVSYPRFSYNGHTPHCYWTSSQETGRPAHLWYLSWLLHWTQTAAVFPRVLQTVSGATCSTWSPGAIPSLPKLPSIHPPPTNWSFRSANGVLSQQSLWGSRHSRESQRASENPVWEVYKVCCNQFLP